jgi:hypothetical protein
MKKIAAIVSILLFAPVLASPDTLIRMTANGFEPSSVTPDIA